MRTRQLGPFSVSAIGFGCMSLSHAYGTPPDRETAVAVLERSLEVGHTFLDTAALYGFGHNETLVGEVLGHRRGEFTLASKCGIIRNAEGKREINGRPETIKATCEESLRRLKTDLIDLYYLHRWDKRVPIEESVGALSDLVAEGKVRTIGLSEVSGATVRKAHAVHPITAVQNEYSPWTRNPEIGLMAACREVGAALVAFSPVGRGFLAGGVRDMAEIPATDIRQNMPRFQGENFRANLALLAEFEALAEDVGLTPAQLSIAWTLAQGDDVIPIPGTQSLDHLEENAGGDVDLDPDLLTRIDALFAPGRVHGARYAPATQAEIDTEQYAAA